jgi:hypothetical protein
VDFLSPCHNISCERFESLSSRLHNRYGHVTCLAFFDIPHDSGFARMRAADDFALGAVLQFSTDMGFHQEPPEWLALYSKISAAELVCKEEQRRIRPRGIVLWKRFVAGWKINCQRTVINNPCKLRRTGHNDDYEFKLLRCIHRSIMHLR